MSTGPAVFACVCVPPSSSFVTATYETAKGKSIKKKCSEFGGRATDIASTICAKLWQWHKYIGALQQHNEQC